MLKRLREKEWYKDLEELLKLYPVLKWALPAAAATWGTVVTIVSKTVGRRPFDVIIIFATLAAWAILGLVHAAIWFFSPRPDIKCIRVDVEPMNIQDDEEGVSLVALAVMRNEVNRASEARGIVARIDYYDDKRRDSRLFSIDRALWYPENETISDMNHLSTKYLLLCGYKSGSLYAAGAGKVASTESNEPYFYQILCDECAFVRVELKGTRFKRCPA